MVQVKSLADEMGLTCLVPVVLDSLKACRPSQPQQQVPTASHMSSEGMVDKDSPLCRVHDNLCSCLTGLLYLPLTASCGPTPHGHDGGGCLGLHPS